MLALKEWGAVVHALLQGRQQILLRKGGIHEKAFDPHADTREPVLLYPTVAHTHAERTRPEHHDLLRSAAGDATEEQLVLRAAVRIVEVIEVQRAEGVTDLSELHIWTEASIRRDRIEFRPKHPLQIMVVQPLPLREVVILPRLPAHGGCRSWIEVTSAAAPPAPLPEPAAALGDVVERVRCAVRINPTSW